MKTVLAILFCIFSILGENAQTLDIGNGKTYAVVVGISDYQNIPDLLYAHRDAQSFADWLRSPAGGSLPEDNIKLLLNEKATRGKVIMDLYWLMEVCREGDRAIIYFSGHGDIEAKLLNQLGFLLCWDSPSFAYLAGGGVEVNLLQEIVNTLSLRNKAKVLLITDACRAGKLAGSDINGPGLTTSNLYQQFDNAMKILSCQPNEVSLEGEQWGGGHGAFSYHLIDALYGLADQDSNRKVELREVGRYLEDNVPKEVAPQEQNPLVVGDRGANVALVDSALIVMVKRRKAVELPKFSPGDMRGIVEEVLANADKTIQQAYYDFTTAVEQKALISPGDGVPPADSSFEALVADASIQRLHGHIKRMYVAALMDEVQQFLNTWMLSEIQRFSEQGGDTLYRFAPGYLSKAAEILGKSHYLYNDLKAKEYFFRAQEPFWNSELLSGGKFNPKDTIVIRKMLDSAYAFNEQLPFLYAFEAAMVRGNFKDYPRAENLYLKAIKLAPGWAFEHAYLGLCYIQMRNFKQAKKSLEKAIELKPDFGMASFNLALIYCREGQVDKAIELSENALRMDSRLYCSVVTDPLFRIYEHSIDLISYNDLGKKHCNCWLNSSENNPDINLLDGQAWCHMWGLRDYEKALTDYRQALGKGLETGDTYLYQPETILGWIYYIKKDYANAKAYFLKRLERKYNDPKPDNSYSLPYIGLYFSAKATREASLAASYLDSIISGYKKQLWRDTIIGILPHLAIRLNLPMEALEIGSVLIEQFPNNAAIPFQTALVHLNILNQPKEAIKNLKKCSSIDSSYPYVEYHLARAYLLLDKKKKAFDWLERALQKSYVTQYKMDNDTSWNGVREDGKFQSLMKAYVTEKTLSKT